MLKSNSHSFSKNQCKRELAAAGFSPMRTNQGDAPDGVSFMVDDQWIRLISNSPPNSLDPLKALMGQPGLWKLITCKDRQPRKVFEFPLFLVAENNPDFETDIEQAISPLTAILQWARNTLNGEGRSGWRCPPKQQIMDLLSPESLTLQCGSFVRQGELICKPQRLALQFPLIIKVSDNLPDNRRYWLRHLLIDAQNRWKLVRIGFRDEPSATSVQAEVDLTGAPRSMLFGLLTIAVSALHAAVTWVMPPAQFLAEQATDIWALNVLSDPNVE